MWPKALPPRSLPSCSRRKSPGGAPSSSRSASRSIRACTDKSFGRARRPMLWRTSMMNISSFIGVACAAAAIATAMPAAAQVGETVTLHFEQAIPNIPGKSLVAQFVDYAPGGASLPHAHAKSAFIFAYVLSGEIESQVNDEPKRVYRTGESWYETPGSTHRVSRNASTTAPAKLLAVFVVDTDEKNLTTPLK